MGSHHEVSVFTALLERFFHVHPPDYLVMSVAIVLGWTAFLLIARMRFREDNPGTVQIALEGIVKFVRALVLDVIGPHGIRFIPVIGLFAVFILTSNFCGMIPMLQPPTAHYSVTLSLALISFIYYNAIGIREHGLLKYLKHFMGPPMGGLFGLFLGCFLFCIEIISDSIRIVSLSVRLFANIFGEHESSAVFRSLVPLDPGSWKLILEIPGALIAPIPVMLLGILASLLQVYIFIMLSSIYLALATEHGEGEGDHGEPHGEEGAHGAQGAPAGH